MGQCPSGICLLLLLLGLHDNSGKGLFIYYVIADLGGWGGVIGLLHFGPLPQKINGKSVKLAVPAILLNFVHVSTLFFCHRYTSDLYAHFTFSDTIWPLLLSYSFGTQGFYCEVVVRCSWSFKTGCSQIIGGRLAELFGFKKVELLLTWWTANKLRFMALAPSSREFWCFFIR